MNMTLIKKVDKARNNMPNVLAMKSCTIENAK